jgi:hypothetical protein
MDVHCTTCGEPWDVHHLWQDAIHDTGLTADDIEAWKRLPRNQRLAEQYAKEFATAGWEFDGSVINVTRCPCCPKHARPDPDRLATKSALTRLLGDDEDGLAATFDDYHL